MNPALTSELLGVGVGLRPQHYREVVRTQPSVGWFEVHSENFFGAGGQPHYFLEQVRAHYPVSLHGVGLSLGSVDPLNIAHIHKLKQLIARYDPVLVSEHVCWGMLDGRHWNDLLPLPYTEEALNHVCRRIEQTQELLGRQILIENISSFFALRSCSYKIAFSKANLYSFNSSLSIILNLSLTRS